MKLRLAIGLIVLAHAASAAAQQAPPAPSPFGIVDNSFLVEESFNQDAGVFQNIFMFTRDRDGVWAGSFTQEWPVRSERHQLSFTVPFQAGAADAGLGNVVLNYRFQLSDETDARPACSPRFSLIAPSSSGTSGWGWQTNVPVSKRAGRVYFHANAGLTRADAASSPFIAGSGIFAVRPMLNLMFEVYVQNDPGPQADRVTTTIVIPGFRTGWNFGERQFVIGAGVPITRGVSHDTAILGYVSYELPFR